MKYLSDYIQDSQTKLFNDLGAFFAFSNKQLEEAQKGGIKYVSMGAGLICPKENAKALNEGLNNIAKEGMKKDVSENGKEAVIKRELYNHECFYTMDTTDCINKLSGYGITKEEIQKVYNAEFSNACESM